MAVPEKAKIRSCYRNKEISFLSYNDRILQEAENSEVPLGDRIKFLGFYSSNLDEFYRIRVANLMRYAKLRKDERRSDSLVVQDPVTILKDINAIVLAQRDRFERLFNTVIRELQAKGIQLIVYEELTDEQVYFVKSYFEESVRPKIFPMMLDMRFKFPDLHDKALYLAVRLNFEEKKSRFSLIEIPTKILPRFVLLPGSKDEKQIVLIDDVVRIGLPSIFRMLRCTSFEAYNIKITRDANFDVGDDLSKSYLDKIGLGLKKRKLGPLIRFIYDQNMPEDMLELIKGKLKIQKLKNLIPGGRYHYFRDFISFDRVVQLDHKSFAGFLSHNRFASQQRMLRKIRAKDILLHFPFHSFDLIIDLLREASIDPKVESIQITLYRVARHSSVMNALINAQRNRKDVTVILELQARFDEKSNMYWANKLKDEGVRVIFGVQGLKIHTKLCLITRREKSGIRYYAAVGTGNFNEDTARLYTDSYLLTADQEIATEVFQVFEFLQSTYDTSTYRHLIVSPFHMRKRLIRCIQREKRFAREGKQAEISIKVNNLADRDIIKHLYSASRAGVKIRLVVRSMFSLITGVRNVSENIEAISIVDKYLEHSRYYIFGNDGDPEVFLSSADLMQRNIDGRLEVTCPLYDPDLKKEILDIFAIYWRDTKKARILDGKLSNEFRTDGEPLCAQDEIYRYLAEKHHPA